VTEQFAEIGVLNVYIITFCIFFSRIVWNEWWGRLYMSMCLLL